MRPLVCRCWNQRSLSSYASTKTIAASYSSSSEAKLIQPLDLDQKIEKIPVTRSVISSFSIRKLDKSIFKFPAVIAGVDEYLHTLRQRTAVRDNFARLMIESPFEDVLDKFSDLFRLSVTESSSVYESMGESMYKTDALTMETTSELRSDPLMSRNFNCNVVKLLIRNHLIMPMIVTADNPDLKKRVLDSLKNKDNGCKRIAFAYTEKHESLGSMLPADWTSEAKMKDSNTWLVSGSKSFILHDEYDHYLIFCKTANYVPEIVYRPEDISLRETRNDFAVTAFLLPKERIDSIDVFSDAGISYQRIRFPSLMLTTDDMVFAPSESGIKVNAVKGIAQIQVASFLLGRMKAACESCARHMDEDGELDHPIRWIYLHEIISRIYRLESVIYYTAGLYDSFEGRDLTPESMLVKLIANETAHEVADLVQRIVGPGHPVAGPMHDCFEMYSSFLDCPLHCKLMTAMHMYRLWGQYNNDHVHKRSLMPFFPSYIFTDYFKRAADEDDETRMIFELEQFFHPSLEKEAKMIEYAILRLDYLMDEKVTRYKNEVNKVQMMSRRIGEYAAHVLACIAVLTRASAAIDRKSPGDEQEDSHSVDQEVAFARDIIRKSNRHFKRFDHTIEYGDPWDRDTIRIHRRNTYYDGYFPFSPMDKIMY